MQAGGNVLGKPKGWSLLHLAAALGLEPSVKLLLSKGVPVNGVHPEVHCQQSCMVIELTLNI